MIKKLLLITLAFLLIFSTGCVEEPQKNPYEGKTCIQCGKAASHSVSGPNDFFMKYGSLNSTNHTKSSVNGVITVYFCDNCDDMPVASMPVPLF